MKTETVKGFSDFIGGEAQKRAEVKKIIEETFGVYGFEPAETPIVEYEEFVRGENPDDEAVSDIFKLQDKGKRKLALRYEFTFQLKRIAKNKKLPYKRYQIGPVFRDEPVSSNRFRQFTQCDVDIIGSTIKDEAEILAISSDIFKKLNIPITININNRKLLNEILDKEGVKKKQEVIKEIDKLDKLSESEIKSNLKKYNAEKVLQIFKKPEKYFEKYDSYDEIKLLKKLCADYKIKINFQPSLARGLSYYNGSVFEIKTKQMKETITAGGSFLVEGTQATGISFGLDRLTALAKIQLPKIQYMIISINQDKAAIKIAQELRAGGKSTILFYGKPSKALEYANSLGIEKVIFVGEKEVKSKKFKVKDMKDGKEKIVGAGEFIKN